MPIFDVNTTNSKDESVVQIRGEDFQRMLSAYLQVVEQLKKLNVYMAMITDNNIKDEDIDDE